MPDGSSHWGGVLRLFTVPFIKNEKSRKKVLTNTGTGDIIMKMSERDSEKHKSSIERLKKAKKLLTNFKSSAMI